MLTINHNGSKWAGQEPDSIEVLFERLASEPLDPRFEQYGNFILPDNLNFPTIRFWGNFLNVSAAFSIDTDDPGLIKRLTAAIKANQQRTDYRAARSA